MIPTIYIPQQRIIEMGLEDKINLQDCATLAAIKYLIGSGFISFYILEGTQFFWLSGSLIAEKIPISGMTGRTLHRSMLRLEEAGLIVHNKELSQTTGKSLWALTSLYTNLFLPESRTNLTGGFDKIVKGGMTNLSGDINKGNIESKEDNNTPLYSPKGESEIFSGSQNGSVKEITPKSELNHLTPQVAVAPLTASDGWRQRAFDTIWNESTKRGSKKSAEKAFKSKIKTKDEAIYLLASVRLIAAAVKANRKELTFTPHISTLINSGNYSDESYMAEFKSEVKKEVNQFANSTNINYV